VEGIAIEMTRTKAPWELTNEMLVKTVGKTDPKCGSRPEDRPMTEYLRYGIINLDKPAGPSSHEIAAWVRRILKVQGIGHGGTLEAQ
jgi:H/ACA ribonucleoprotein complex subunit 4